MNDERDDDDDEGLCISCFLKHTYANVHFWVTFETRRLSVSMRLLLFIYDRGMWSLLIKKLNFRLMCTNIKAEDYKYCYLHVQDRLAWMGLWVTFVQNIWTMIADSLVIYAPLSSFVWCAWRILNCIPVLRTFLQTCRYHPLVPVCLHVWCSRVDYEQVE